MQCIKIFILLDHFQNVWFLLLGMELFVLSLLISLKLLMNVNTGIQDLNKIVFIFVSEWSYMSAR